MQYNFHHRLQENYKEENAEPVRFDVAKLEKMGLEVIKKDIATIQSMVLSAMNATNLQMDCVT